MAKQKRENLLEALRALAQKMDVAVIDHADIATLAGVSVASVRRELGPRENFPALLSFREDVSDTRQRILEAAARVFARKGYAGASLDEIAADAGMTKGAIYWHFRNKQDLFFALVDKKFQRDTAPLVAAVTTVFNGKDSLTGFKELMRGVFERIQQDPDWVLLYLEVMGQARDPELLPRLAVFQEQALAMLENLIRQLQLSGRYDTTCSPRDMALLFHVIVDGVVLANLINPGRMDVPALSDSFMTMLWQGVAPKQ